MLQETKIDRRPEPVDLPQNMSKQDIVRASDFNFMTVLGKGSFGKVLAPGQERFSAFRSR